MLRAGKPVKEFPLKFTGVVSEFGGEIQIDEPGHYVLEVTAASPEHQNFGMATAEIVVN
ncbi:MAG: hypothetical protein JSU96_12900 [Acidobacteriota bacterium]|nr:MAG: hypothetical protein JSU96_12900 [Acidobacteriota bacterium]